jgi:hypothetical protein
MGRPSSTEFMATSVDGSTRSISSNKQNAAGFHGQGQRAVFVDKAAGGVGDVLACQVQPFQAIVANNGENRDVASGGHFIHKAGFA